eukprot:766114-Hanusia_phi.AAC.7
MLRGLLRPSRRTDLEDVTLHNHDWPAMHTPAISMGPCPSDNCSLAKMQHVFSSDDSSDNVSIPATDDYQIGDGYGDEPTPDAPAPFDRKKRPPILHEDDGNVVINLAMQLPESGFTLSLLGRVIDRCNVGLKPSIAEDDDTKAFVEVAPRHKGLIQWDEQGTRLTLQSNHVDLPFLFDNKPLESYEAQVITPAGRNTVDLFMKNDMLPPAGVYTLRRILAAFEHCGFVVHPATWRQDLRSLK